MALKLHDWTEKYQGHIHSGLFSETDDLDGAVDRSRKFDGKTTEIVVHQWGGRCCSETDPFGNIFDPIEANQKGAA
jgi:hypothetical protein